MSMLKSIAITGFKSFGAEVEVPLGPLNVLIGANGSGKSNFLDAFSFVRGFESGELINYVRRAGGGNKLLHFGSRNTQEFSITLILEDGDKFELIYLYDKEDTLYPGLGTSGEAKHSDSKVNRELRMRQLRKLRRYHFHDTGFHSPMKKTSNLHDNRFLREDGSNLASFLYLLRERHESSYRMIRNTIRQVAPFFDDFVLEPVALNPDTIRLEWRHRNSDAYFDASSLSDGTLRFMALTALLLQPAELRPGIVLLDEPELGLHPYAVAMLAAMLRSASTETQIVVATQSPGLLDHFEPEDILVAERVAGETRLNRLEAKKLEAWLEDYSLGELWEKNHFGGRLTNDPAGA